MSVERELERLFWPAPKRARGGPPGRNGITRLLIAQARLDRQPAGAAIGLDRPAHLRAELKAHLRKAPQVLAKITGKSRGMAGVNAHLRYIADGKEVKYATNEDGVREVREAWDEQVRRRAGDSMQRPIITESGERIAGWSSLDDLLKEWSRSPSAMPWTSDRSQAVHILWQMPADTDPRRMLQAVQATAAAEFEGHKYAMALHQHQSTPHVHLIVRMENNEGRRLNPRKADLHRWRLRFAHELRERGIDAAASRQRTRGYRQRHERLWEKKLSARQAALRERATYERALGHPNAADELEARADGMRRGIPTRSRPLDATASAETAQARNQWNAVRQALEGSSDPRDRALARSARAFMQAEFEPHKPARTPGVARPER